MKLIYINLIIILSAVFFLNYYFRFKISYFLNILDKPDRVKKLHSNIIPLNECLVLDIFIMLIFEYIF